MLVNVFVYITLRQFRQVLRHFLDPLIHYLISRRQLHILQLLQPTHQTRLNTLGLSQASLRRLGIEHLINPIGIESLDPV